MIFSSVADPWLLLWIRIRIRGSMPLANGSGSRSIHLTNGSGSGSRRPKSMGIRWIRIRIRWIRIRIRIRNTDIKWFLYHFRALWYIVPLPQRWSMCKKQKAKLSFVFGPKNRTKRAHTVGRHLEVQIQRRHCILVFDLYFYLSRRRISGPWVWRCTASSLARFPSTMTTSSHSTTRFEPRTFRWVRTDGQLCVLLGRVVLMVRGTCVFFNLTLWPLAYSSHFFTGFEIQQLVPIFLLFTNYWLFYSNYRLLNSGYSVFLHSDHLSLYLKPLAYICISTNGSCVTVQLKALVFLPTIGYGITNVVACTGFWVPATVFAPVL
jgi:hypothetical protein